MSSQIRQKLDDCLPIWARVYPPELHQNQGKGSLNLYSVNSLYTTGEEGKYNALIKCVLPGIHFSNMKLHCQVWQFKDVLVCGIAQFGYNSTKNHLLLYIIPIDVFWCDSL